MKNKSGIYLVVFCLLVLTSCSISMEKRRYRSGYHVEIVKNQPRTITKPFELPENKWVQSGKDVQSPNTSNKEESAEIRSNYEKPVQSPQRELKKRDKKKKLRDSCDVIFTAVGERIQAKVIEITDEYIHYKLCDDPKGRLYAIKSKMVDNITLRNGELYIPPNRTIVDKDYERKKSETLFIMSIVSLSVAFIAFVFSFFITPFGTIAFILAILSGIFSFILALIDIRPGRFVPSYRTKLTWIFYLIVLLLVIATLIISFL